MADELLVASDVDSSRVFKIVKRAVALDLRQHLSRWNLHGCLEIRYDPPTRSNVFRHLIYLDADQLLSRAEALKPMPTKMDHLLGVEPNLIAVQDLGKNPSFRRVFPDVPQHLANRRVMPVEIDDRVIDEHAVGPAMTRMPSLAKFDDKLNNFVDLLTRSVAGQRFDFAFARPIRCNHFVTFSSVAAGGAAICALYSTQC
jgi:hypothetical protein